DIFRVNSIPARNQKKPLFLQAGTAMGQKFGSFAFVSGCFLMLLGLALVPAALAQHDDETILGGAICAFAFGAFAAAAGLYLKARMLKGTTPRAIAAPKQRGGCEVCKSEAPVIHC